jgi:hypothetical protein
MDSQDLRVPGAAYCPCRSVILSFMNNPLLNFLRRSEVCRLLANAPSILDGATRAKTWPTCKADIAEERSPSDNPLRSYFDSVTQGPGIWKWTHYFDIYDRHFRQFVGKKVHVVEVGIYSGGSLDMWRDYFGSQCCVYGVDIEGACKAYEKENTRVFIGDQSDRNFWRDFRKQVPQVDIVIDDGGHHPVQQIVTLEEMLPHVRSGGIYVCEDIHGKDNRFGAYVYGLAKSLNLFAKEQGVENAVVPSGFQAAISSIHQYPFVTVIEKRRSSPTRFVAPKHGTEWQPFL